MKAWKTLVITGGLCVASGAQAVAISDMDIYINWSSLAITGPLGSPVSITDPVTGEVLSSSAEGWVGSNSVERNFAHSINGASAIASYSDSVVNAMGGYDAATNEGGGSVVVTNSDMGQQSAWAGMYRNFIYQATGTGQVTVSVDYSLTGNVSTNTPYEYANGGYELKLEAGNADLWISTYNAAIGSGSDQLAAEAAAEQAAIVFASNDTNWQVAESFGCNAAVCASPVNQSGIMSMTFDVVADTKYFIGFDATVSGYTQATSVSAVPVPAAAWLFGSGLLGLMGVARRKAA